MTHNSDADLKSKAAQAAAKGDIAAMIEHHRSIALTEYTIYEENQECDRSDCVPNPTTIEGLNDVMPLDGEMGLLFFDIGNFFVLHRVYGENFTDHILHRFQAALREQTGLYLADSDIVTMEKVGDGGFIMLFKRSELNLKGLADLATTLRLGVSRSVNQEMVKMTGQHLEIKTGYAKIRHHETEQPAKSFYDAFCDAQSVAAGKMSISRLRLMDEFRSTIEGPSLRAVYMPIVDLRSGRVMGWESLTRGPEGTQFQQPSVLFDFAEEVGSLFSLERVCRELAFRNIGNLNPEQKLFLNIHPHTIGDPKFTSGETRELLKQYGLQPEQIVFEITERHPIKDFTYFFRTLENYRSQGYQVAIDDVGAGYSGLWTLGQVRPDYIKVDMAIVRGVDANRVHRSLIETLVAFAEKIGALVIAEGIETETELSSLMDMGVHYGQGYFLAKPAWPKPGPETPLPVRPILAQAQSIAGRCSIPIGELAEPALTVPPTVKISEVQQILETIPPSPISGVVVVDDGQPIGLVMSHDLNRQLGTLYGVALYYERPITRLMDASPLIVEETIPVEQVAERATNRDKYKVYDHILVTRKGKFIGVSSVQKMLDSLARVQVEMAKGANPLTGLPGNVAIEREIDSRATPSRPFSLIYADLDNFKVFNDVYGFESGDKMILLLSKILIWSAARHGGQEGYVGHIGGDDFAVIVPPHASERTCRSIIRLFARLSLRCFSPEHLRQGYIEGRGRDDELRRFPLTSASLAIVDCWVKSDLNQLAQRAAEMKKYAKSKPGNVWVRDRRRLTAPSEAEPLTI